MIQRNPLVTVLIPNYCYAPFLNERIDSILAQTYQNFEIIILDDCSTDNSKDVIEQYRSHPKVKDIVYNQTNSGSPFKQWDKGLKLSRGELVWIAESDDSCKPDFLENLVKQFEMNTNLAVAYAQSTLIDSNGKVIKQPNCSGETTIYNGLEFIRTHLLYGVSIINASMAIFNREKAFCVDRIFKRVGSVGDWMFWVLMAETGDIAEIHKPLNLFRIHDESVTRRNLLKVASEENVRLILNYIYSRHIINKKEFDFVRLYHQSRFKDMEIEDNEIKQSLVSFWNTPPVSIYTRILFYLNIFTNRVYRNIKKITFYAFRTYFT